jgi:hypothetical protein
MSKDKIQKLKEENKKLKSEIRRLNSVGSKLIRCLDFYANPETYFAISFLPDPPSGGFIYDFSETDLGRKPGKRARKTLDKIMSMYHITNENKS